MRIFLTGGTGVIGTRALPALVTAGHTVTAVACNDGRSTIPTLPSVWVSNSSVIAIPAAPAPTTR